MTISTPKNLQAKNRRLDRRLAEINDAAAAMRAGAALHLTYRPRPRWTLSTGTEVTDAAARVIIATPTSSAWVTRSSTGCPAKHTDGFPVEVEPAK